MKPWVLVIACAMLVGGCQTYVSAPLKLSTFPNQLEARRLGDPDHVWSVSELLPIAFAQNPDIAAARARLISAQSQARAAKAGPLSGLTFSAEYTNNAGTSPWLYGASLDLPMDTGVRKAARLTQADLDRLRASYDYEAVLWTVRTSLAHALASRNASSNALRVAEELADIRQKRVDILDARVSAGEDARSAALVARTDLAIARRRVAEILTRRKLADFDLGKALGLGQAAIQSLRLAAPEDLPTSWPTTMRPEAALGRPEVLAAVVDYDSAEANLRLEVAKQFPELRLGPAYAWDHGAVKLPFNLALVLPPLDLNRANIRTAEARRQEAARNLDAVQARVLDQGDRARANLGQARLQLALIRDRDLPAAQGLANAAKRALKAGEGDQPDTLMAEAVLLETELAGIDAQAGAQAALIDLEDALRESALPQDMLTLRTEIQLRSRR